MICYNDVKMWVVHTKESEYNQKTGKHKKLKTPVVTEKVYVSEVSVYDLGELYELMKFATERDPYNKINVSFTVRTEY
tara:strand:+ start:159 stop:392 length:234 start_codon:yes stop_codon:yes gene_type:complete